MKKFILTLCISLLLIGSIRAHPLCVNGDGPAKPETPLELCADYNDAGCCTIDTEATIKAELANSGVADGECRTLLKQILCSRCDSWAAHLFDAESGNGVREAPFLCTDYCGRLWSACQNVVINANPFDEQKRSISLNELYTSQQSFCAAYKTNSGQYCYSGTPFVPTVITDSNFTETVCVERILDTNTYLVMAITPVASDNRLFFGTQSGKIDIYDKDSQAISGTFLDISAKTFINGETGMHGLTFHPDFETNGLFYVVYSCPPSNANCKWACDRGCPYGNCKADGYCENLSHVQIIEEYKVDGAWSSNRANPSAVRRILEYPHPYANHNGGDVHFGPEDGYLYTTTGDGGYQDDPFYSSQDLDSILGKVLRIDVNNKQDNKEYAIPSDNPFVGDNDALPEIWAYGLRNPYRFSFDKVTGKMWVGDVGGAVVEEVDIITKGGNYGWSRYEGNEIRRADKPEIPNHIGPAMAYYRTFIDPACVIGGYVYRASMNPCLQGTYLFADYFGVLMQGKEVAEGSDIWNMYKVSMKCAASSPKACRALQIVFSFGQDRNNDMYILAKDAVFKIVESSKCGLTCVAADKVPVNQPVTQTPISDFAPSTIATPTVNNQVTSSGSVLINSLAFIVIAIASIFIH